MITVDESEGFMHAFVAADAELQRFALGDDRAGVKASKAEFERRFLGPSVQWEQEHARAGSPEHRALVASLIVPRPLFRADRHDGGDRGPLVAWMAGQNLEQRPARTVLWRRYVVGGTPGGPRLLSYERLCLDCHCSGRLADARPCPGCAGEGWRHVGERFGHGPELQLGPPLETRRLRPPSQSAYLAAWER